jgi:hypothetical protein
MSDTGWVSPGTAVNDASIGSYDWSAPSNVFSSNDAYASYTISSDTDYGFSASDNAVRIVKGGSIGATDKSSVDAWPSTEASASYGGSSDLWGETWEASDINGSGFGLAISAVEDGYTSDETKYLKVTNFGFSIPTGALIEGIEVSVEKQAVWDGGNTDFYIRIDHIQIKVYYTETDTPIVGTKYPLPAFKHS